MPNAWLIGADAPKEAVLAQAVSHVVDHFGRVQREKAEASASREELLGWVPKALNRSCETIDTNSHKLNGSEAYPSNEYYLARLTNGRAYLLPRRSAPMTVAGLDLYKPQKLAARMAKTAAMAAIRLGLADNLFVSVAAQRCIGVPDSSDVFDFIRSFFSEEIRFAISLGTLSRQRKPVLQVMDAGAKILGYAKVGWNPESIALVQNEAEIGSSLTMYGRA